MIRVICILLLKKYISANAFRRYGSFSNGNPSFTREKPEDIPYETLSDYARFVNLQAADALGVEITEDILASYRVLVEADGTSHFGE